MSAASSNLIPKNNTPAHKNIAEFIDGARQLGGGIEFTLDGNRGIPKSELCRKLPGGQTECTEIAMEAKDLFQAMQNFGYFCQLPQDPAKTFISCQRIPQQQ